MYMLVLVSAGMLEMLEMLELLEMLEPEVLEPDVLWASQAV